MSTIASRIPRAARLERGVDAPPVAVLRRPRIVLTAVCTAAALLFLYQLGRSSFFIDETYSWIAASGDLSSVERAVRFNEVTPPLYYLILHGWIGLTGADTELMLRLPSVAAGVGLVAATYWLATLIANRAAGLVAAVLTAAAPLTLLYAQQVRAYIWVMLAVTIAVAAGIRATRDGPAGRWLALSLGAAAAGFLLHYTAALVTLPLALWIARSPDIDRRWRLGYLAGTAAPLLALVPLLLEQMGRDHQGGTEKYATVNAFNLLRVFGTPFDGRATEDVMASRELGMVAAIDALALIAFADRFKGLRSRKLLVACALAPLVAVIVISALAQPVALTRYTAVAAPFMLVAIAVAVVTAPRALGVALLAMALIACVLGIVPALQASGQHPDSRGAVTTAADDWRKGDKVISVNQLGYDGALRYYAERHLPKAGQDVGAFPTLAAAVDAPQLRDSLADGKRVWIVSDPPMPLDRIRRNLASVDYQPLQRRVFSGNARIQLVLAGPRP